MTDDLEGLAPKKKGRIETSGWIMTPKLEPSKKHLEEVKLMSDAIRATTPLRKRLAVPEGMTSEEFILSLQSPSTREIIEKQKDPNYKRDWSAPLPDNWLANKDAKNRDEMTGNRKELGLLDIDQVNHVEAIRRRSKNTLGQSEKSSSSEESKARARHHFLVHPPADITKEQESQITELSPSSKGIPQTTIEIWKPLTPWQAFKHWLKGNKVRRDRE